MLHQQSRPRQDRTPSSCLVAAAVCLSLAATAAALSQAPGTQAPSSEHSRLLRLHHEAVALLTRAARADTGRDEVHRALADAAQRIEALATDPVVGSEAPGTFPRLTAGVRADLRRAAGELTALSARGDGGARPDPGRRVDTAPYLALLERARVQLAGEVALGLSFQGSYSQTQAKEPVYGGHASAMGPAPAPLPSGGDESAPSPVTFEEGARLPTRTYCGSPTKDHVLESGGNGLALVDYDGDGLLDIYLVTAAELTPARERIAHRNALYRNLGDWKFEDVSSRAGVDAAAWGNGVCAGDADGDGQLDLYVTNWGPNFLFRNRGNGTFEEVAAKAGVAAGGWSTGCTFFDADADGDLDLYVARYVETSWDEVVRAKRTLVWRDGPRIMVGPAGLPGEADLFFENLGDGRFTETGAARGLADSARAYGFGVVATDYDDDGFVDLFVANDSNPNFLYRNLGNGRFESAALLAGVAVNDEARAQAGMGADAGDYDGDGRLDVVLTAFAHDRNTIYRNVDGRQFEDATAAAGIAAPTFKRMGWGAAFVDADLDGRLDLFFANGHIFANIDGYPQLGETYRQKNQLLLNQGSRFRDVSERAGGGLQIARVGRGLAVGDLDNDGDLDLVVSNVDDVPTVLENRQQTGHHWVAFRVVSPSANRFALGAKVTIEAGGRRQVREIRSGGSYLSQSDLRASFGLGTLSEPVNVEVRMPGGRRWHWKGLAVDRLHVLELTGAATVTASADTRSTVAARVTGLTRDSSWRLASSVPVRFTTHHPQGMVRIADTLLVSSVEIRKRTRRFPTPVDGYDRDTGDGIGHLFKMDLEGNLLGDLTLGEGSIYHPGGIDYDGSHVWVPVAEYRPNSRSIIYRVDPTTMQATAVLRVADHIGGILHNTDDGTLHGVSWGSRRFYRWALGQDSRTAADGATPAWRTLNPSHYVDYQDCKYAGARRMLCTGVTEIRLAPGTAAMRLGGIDLVDLADGRPIHQVPVLLWTADGTAMTRNPVWIEPQPAGLRAYFMPEDDRSTLYIYDVETCGPDLANSAC